MRQAIKSKVVQAYELGAGTKMEVELIAKGKIVITDAGYELFSQEAVNEKGEIASAGDFFKLSSTGEPYPNDRKWFWEHHQHLTGNDYLQSGTPLFIWQVGDPVSEELLYLLNNEKLHLNTDNDECYFEAELWGTLLNAKKDATIVFYSIDRDKLGNITDIQFNFVAKTEFERDYQLL